MTLPKLAAAVSDAPQWFRGISSGPPENENETIMLRFRYSDDKHRPYATPSTYGKEDLVGPFLYLIARGSRIGLC